MALTIEQWAKTWKKAGAELERIRLEELRHFKNEEHFETIDALLELGARFSQPRPYSGLVEQQRLFRKLRP